MEHPLPTIFTALADLAQVFQWHALVSLRFNRHLDRVRARELTVGEMLQDLPAEQRPVWRAAFEGLRHAWEIAWPFVTRYQCTPIPPIYRDTSLNERSPLSMCIATESEEGICSLALTMWLVEQHNAIVEVVQLAKGQKPTEVSSRMITGSASLLRYSADRLLQYLRARCTTFDHRGRVGHDLIQLEAHLRDELQAPLLRWEHKKFVFLSEASVTASELHAAVPQRPLPPDAVEALRRDLREPSTAHSVRQTVETTVAFLASGVHLGREVGRMLLSEYLQKVLLLEERLPSRALESSVQLEHLDALLGLLAVGSDPFEGVSAKYRAPLEQGSPELAALLAAAPGMDCGVLVGALQRFAAEQLREEFLSAEEPMKGVLGMLETDQGTDLARLDWFGEQFPDELQMKHWVATCKALSA